MSIHLNLECMVMNFVEYILVFPPIILEHSPKYLTVQNWAYPYNGYGTFIIHTIISVQSCILGLCTLISHSLTTLKGLRRLFWCLYCLGEGGWLDLYSEIVAVNWD